jgi:hypothetical protein
MFSSIHFFVKMNNVDSPEIYFSEIIKKFISSFWKNMILELVHIHISVDVFPC